MDMELLRTELQKPEYAELTDLQSAEAINAKTVSRSRLVQTWEVQKLATERGYWPAIVIASEPANTVTQVRALAISIVDWVKNPKISTIDIGLESVQALIGGLVLSGLMTQQQADELIALGTETVRWTVANGLPYEIGIGNVINARRGN